MRRNRRAGRGHRPGDGPRIRRTAAACDHRHRDHRRHGDRCGNDRTGPSHARRPRSSARRALPRFRFKAIVIKFDKETCRPCPVRDQCTRSKTGGPTLSPQPREVQEVLDHARLQQGDEQWRAKYGPARASREPSTRPSRSPA
ncbi:transposase [Streptomyces inhibens]|uniref:transposase n=1 Tax=Streptomyces inhibens TaxID=2293571 RepID=UPI0037A43EF1